MVLPSITTGTVLTDLAVILVTTIALTVAYLKLWHYKYWERLNVPYLEPTLVFGNTKDILLMRRSPGQVFKECYQRLKSQGCKFGGMFLFSRPVLLAIDPEFIKNIMVRDFQYFMDRGRKVDKSEPLSANLLNFSGQKWKDMRSKLTPTFTSGKMKFMFQTLVDCSDELEPILTKYQGQPIEIKELVARYATDVIGSCAFGVECNSLKDPNSEFRKVGKMALETTPMRAIKRIAVTNYPRICKALHISVALPYVTDFFRNIVKETLEYREKHHVVRKDFMDLMIQLKNKGRLLDDDSEGVKSKEGNDVKVEGGSHHAPVSITMDEITAQSFLFFAAGFETSSTTLTYCFYELSQNLDVQDKLRREIHEVLAKHDGKITYDSIGEMKYMDNVVNETLRRHPPVPLVNRDCTQDYQIPDTDIILKEGTQVFIPCMALHHDPEYFPNPQVFDPDRFTEENRKTWHPFAFLPFGEGPRNCIGLRFGKMQIKVALVALLKEFKWTMSPKTKLPIRTKPSGFLNATVDTIWLLANKI